MRLKLRWPLVITAITFLFLVCWTFYFPFEEHKLFAAVPGRAFMVSFHDKPVQRLDLLKQSTLLGVMTGGNKTDGFNPDRYAPALKMFFGRNVIAAKVPLYERPGQSVWVFSSWAGAANQLIRFGLAFPLVKGLKPQRFEDGSAFWTMGEGQREISFCVKGGVLFGVFGKGGNLLHEMASRIDASSPDDYSLIRSRIDTARQAFPGRRDIAWISGVPDELSSSGEGLVSIDESAEGSRVDLVLNKQIEAGSDLASGLNIPEGLSGDMLDILLVSGWQTVSKLIRRSPGGTADTVMSFVDEVSGGEGRIFAGMLKQDFSGTIYNLKVPVVIAGVEVKPGADVTKKVFELMDQLNADHGLGVIPVRVPTEGKPLIVAGGSKMNFFGGIKQRPALIEDNGWLIICSDMQSLLSILNNERAGHADSHARWRQMLAKDQCAAGAYVDFAEAEMAIRNIIAVYTLSLIAEGEATVAKRKQLDRIRAAVEKLADAGDATMSITSENQVTRIELLISPPDRDRGL